MGGIVLVMSDLHRVLTTRDAAIKGIFSILIRVFDINSCDGDTQKMVSISAKSQLQQQHINYNGSR